jgi:hypothetical protein
MVIAAVPEIFSLANAADSTEKKPESRIRPDGKFDSSVGWVRPSFAALPEPQPTAFVLLSGSEDF